MWLYVANRLHIPSPACFLNNPALSLLWPVFWDCFELQREFSWSAGSMLRRGLFSVSGDETDGQLEGPVFCVPDWTLVNHLMRAEGTCPQSRSSRTSLCLFLPPHILSSHTHTHTHTQTHMHRDELFLTLASCILKHTQRQGMFVFLLNS